MTAQTVVEPNCPSWCEVTDHARDPEELEHWGHFREVVMPNGYQPLAYVGPHWVHGAAKLALSVGQDLDKPTLRDPWVMLTCDTYFTAEEARALAAQLVEFANLMDGVAAK